MEILKRGTAHMAEVWRCTCPMCETEVKIIKGDPEIIKYHNWRGSFKETVTWQCPVCETEVNSSTGEHNNSSWTNLTSKKKEVLSKEEKELLDSWNCLRVGRDGSTYYVGTWDSNN